MPHGSFFSSGEGKFALLGLLAGRLQGRGQAALPLVAATVAPGEQDGGTSTSSPSSRSWNCKASPRLMDQPALSFLLLPFFVGAASGLESRKTTRSAVTKSLDRLRPSSSHLSCDRRPEISTGEPLPMYFAVFSATPFHAVTSAKMVCSCSPRFSLIAREKLRTGVPFVVCFGSSSEVMRPAMVTWLNIGLIAF